MHIFSGLVASTLAVLEEGMPWKLGSHFGTVLSLPGLKKPLTVWFVAPVVLGAGPLDYGLQDCGLAAAQGPNG
ncbi:hypothetical protein NDU88_000563 [Pleurodeles waltl]|uniref:Uncharacterized protein n=1 Tax=Pleurodeles waltl TaxID=8319 RepID=A0AAV7MK27_PLEWA|nr:hypothetical protein NDU88_000563 [Pleurodeles waltl]